MNSTLTVLLDSVAGGLGAVLGSTAGIVIFGEIIPQAICSRHGLAVGAATLPITQFFRVIMFPISYPISKILDRVLGQEIGAVFQRHELIELLKLTDAQNDLAQGEMKLVEGALTYGTKMVSEVLTPIADVFMLPSTATLDVPTVGEIVKSGHSRIPVYAGVREDYEIVGMLYARDLIFVDPDDCTPLMTIVNFYSRAVVKVFDDVSLEVMLEEFKTGRTHMVLVQHVVYNEDADNTIELTGVATLEDVIEEIFQFEIVDETDTVLDNATKTLRVPSHFTPAELAPAELLTQEAERFVLSQQMQLVAFTHLATNVPAFSDAALINRSTLKRLIARPECAFLVEEGASLAGRTIYTAGVPSQTFTLVLEGRVDVTVGLDSFTFTAGAFHHFALRALEKGSRFVPDYTATCTGPRTVLLCITRTLYTDAIGATQRGSGGGGGDGGGGGPGGGGGGGARTPASRQYGLDSPLLGRADIAAPRESAGTAPGSYLAVEGTPSPLAAPEDPAPRREGSGHLSEV